MQELDADPIQTLLVGDTSVDVETANALGVCCALVPRGYEDRERLASHGCVVRENLRALADYVEAYRV
jgi:phosphoglycolate phosphatase-like HAD superfamily hydrolase